MKNCSKCKKDKEFKEFAKNQKWCKKCSSEHNKIFRANNPEYMKRKQALQKERLKKIRQLSWDYLKEHPCVDCGEKDPIVLEFDHRRDKKHNISDMIKCYSWNKILKEIEKCDVRCANCHRRKTAKDHNWYKDIDSGIVKSYN